MVVYILRAEISIFPSFVFVGIVLSGLMFESVLSFYGYQFPLWIWLAISADPRAAPQRSCSFLLATLGRYWGDTPEHTQVNPVKWRSRVGAACPSLLALYTGKGAVGQAHTLPSWMKASPGQHLPSLTLC